MLYGGLLFSWVPKAGLLCRSVGRVDHFPLYIRIGGGGEAYPAAKRRRVRAILTLQTAEGGGEGEEGKTAR